MSARSLRDVAPFPASPDGEWTVLLRPLAGADFDRVRRAESLTVWKMPPSPRRVEAAEWLREWRERVGTR